MLPTPFPILPDPQPIPLFNLLAPLLANPPIPFLAFFILSFNLLGGTKRAPTFILPIYVLNASFQDLISPPTV